MSHALMHDRMAYVGDVPWHGLGVKVSEAVTSREMIEKAGLNWRVWKQPAPGARLLDRNQAAYDRYLMMRDPVAGESVPVALGMVGSAYAELQNADAFSFFEPFIDEKFAAFHTAGALDNGQRVWVMAKLRGSIRIGKNDEIDRYLLLSNSHDGSSAVSISFTPVRVVCQNTLNLAAQNRKAAISVSHTRHLTRNLAVAQAKQLEAITEKVFKDATILFERMAGVPTTHIYDGYLASLYPRTDGQKKHGNFPERWHRIAGVLDDETVTPPETRDTLWGLYNAVVHEEDYRATRETEPGSRLGRIWFGSGQAIKLRALQEARRITEAA